MKGRILNFSILTLILLFTIQPANAQTQATQKASQPNQEAIFKEMLNEIHQLRIALERINVNNSRVQILVDRVRLQQGEVRRLSDELSGVRRQLADLRSLLPGLRERIANAEKQQDAGVISSDDLKALVALVDQTQRREQDLSAEENRLATELDVQTVNLSELNRRLDGLEEEIRNSVQK
jgi:predicted  nucleic acid-binding Zn-ribbon protein